MGEREQADEVRRPSEQRLEALRDYLKTIHLRFTVKPPKITVRHDPGDDPE